MSTSSSSQDIRLKKSLYDENTNPSRDDIKNVPRETKPKSKGTGKTLKNPKKITNSVTKDKGGSKKPDIKIIDKYQDNFL